jgi:RNA polymerase sigma factor (sigma-70 family)
MYASSPEQRRRARVQALATELYSERYRYLLRIARRHGSGTVDPDEAVQEAFASFLEAYDPDCGSPPLAWLTLALQRNCWASRDRLARVVPTGQDAPEGYTTPSPAGPAQTVEAVERSERARQVGRRMARLKPAQRRALSLLAVGYSYAEIGELTGWTRTKINRSLAEGRAALRTRTDERTAEVRLS